VEIFSLSPRGFICSGKDQGDSSTQPIDEGEEYELINTMIDELNSKWGLDLSHEISLYRPTITSQPDRHDFMDEVTERVVMVGGSHSSRLTDELDEMCLEVMDISVRGWRVSETAVEEKSRELSEIVATTDESKTTNVYQLFDTSSCYVKKPGSTRTLPGKGADGRYHVDGKLDITNREEVKSMVSMSHPLLRAEGKCRKMILTPSGRYRYNPCCNTRGHCINMKDSNYCRWMEEKLAEVRGIAKDYVRMRNIKRAPVMEFSQLITPSAGQSSYLHEEEIWGEDPVHYTAKGYSLAAAGLESLVYEKRGEEKEVESWGGQGPSKKPKMDLTQNRPS
jgi:hypothetical protein